MGDIGGNFLVVVGGEFDWCGWRYLLVVSVFVGFVNDYKVGFLWVEDVDGVGVVVIGGKVDEGVVIY